MAAILEDGKLRLSGYVGNYYAEDHFTETNVVIALAQIADDSDLTVHINSPGGIASEGAAIHALFSRRAGTTDVVIEGIAMSAASLIAMAGETVTMAAGSVMMIHDPASITWGDSAEHAKSIEMLEALATSYARVYADKSGKSVEACREIMKAESWFTPGQAVEAGFADDTTEKKAEPVAAFDYRVLAHAPRRLVAMAAKKNWRLPDATEAAPTANQPRHNKEISMSENKDGGDLTAKLDAAKAEGAKGAVAAYQARRRTVMAFEETKGREDLAEHLVDSDMSEDAIKATLSKAPKVEATQPSQTAPTAEEYAQVRMTGGVPQPGGQPSPSAGTKSLSANMRKLLGKDAA